MTKKLIVFVIFFIACVLTAIFLKDVSQHEFLYLQDEFLILTKYENFNSFFTLNPTDLGTSNTTTLIVTFFDRAYYAIANQLNINIYDAQHLFYLLKLIIIIGLPFLGFKKLSTIFNKKTDELTVFTISLWYSFNTFTLIYWHGNAFSLTLLLCYALAPLALFYYHNSIFQAKKITDKICFVILLFLMSFALSFFVVFCLLLFFYTILYTFLNKFSIYTLLKNILITALLFLPFTSILFLIPYDMFSNPAKTVNLAGGETYGNIKGGVLYQFLMWFTWAIYTPWEPRNIYSFYKYFLTIPSLIAPFVLYFLIIGGFFKKKRSQFLTLFSFLFIFLVFFAKAAQKPFGEIYLYLINHSSFFRIFRSPDNKLGFGIVLIVAVLLLVVAKEYRKKLFIALLIGVIIIQGSLLFTGVAIKGENKLTSSDRIISLDKEYRQAAEFLNKNSLPYGYVLPLPSVEVGHFELSDGSVFIGQDLLPKLTYLPFLYVSDFSGMLSSAHYKLSQSLQKGDTSTLEEFPIRYYLIRNDVRMKDTDKELNKKLSQTFKLVFKNSRFQVYENPKTVPILQSGNAELERVNPVKFHIYLKNIKKDQSLILHQNFNSNWQLFPEISNSSNKCSNFVIHEQSKTKECIVNNESLNFHDVRYLWEEALPDSAHKDYNGYANAWVISPKNILNDFDPKLYKANPDGSINLELTLFLKTQSVLYAAVMVSGGHLLILIFVLTVNLIKLTYREKYK